MKLAPRFDALPFDRFSLPQNGFSASEEVDIGRGEVLQALVRASVAMRRAAREVVLCFEQLKISETA